MNHQKAKLKAQHRRRNHVRRRIQGTAERPRLTVFRSSKHIYAQLIDDVSGVTLAAASSVLADVRSAIKYGGNIKAAQAVGKKLAEAAKAKGIDKAAFDRGHYKYHGRVKALAEAATQAGLICCNAAKIGVDKPAHAAPSPVAPKAEKKEKRKRRRKRRPKDETRFAACGLSRSQTPVWERTSAKLQFRGTRETEFLRPRSQTGVWEREKPIDGW